MKECIDVARAGGVEFAPVQGKDITKLFDYNNKAKQKFAEILVPIAMKKHFGIVPSMLQDLQKGKPCEVDASNGVVCEWGKTRSSYTGQRQDSGDHQKRAERRTETDAGEHPVLRRIL